MDGPEAVTNGTYDIPEYAMVLTDIRGCSRHPAEVGEYIGITDELLPLGGELSTVDGGVILCFEPYTILMGDVGLDIFGELREGL